MTNFKKEGKLIITDNDIPIMLSKELAKEWVESRWKEFCEAVTE